MNPFLATPEKASNHELKQQTDMVKNDTGLNSLLTSSCNPLLVLNDKRQILSVSQDVSGKLGINEDQNPTGKRIGEIVGCVHSRSMLGCGAALWCRNCSANMAIISCLTDDVPVVENATICVNHPKGATSRCFQIKCTPYRLAEQRLVLLNAFETTRWRNLETLERYFLNDFSRAVTAIDCQSKMARHSRYEDLQDILIDIEQRTLLLSGDIRLQRFLLGQNQEKYTQKPSEISLEKIINHAINSVSESPYIVGKAIERPSNIAETVSSQ
ncbi:MAG: hypothetical protein KKB51_06175 [Candidatus Riflebacteria bacterium]|nr:hypothetical protein [Candidatus Riflebacteria bacterium]